MNGDRTIPKGDLGKKSAALADNKNLLDFLLTLKRHGLLDDTATFGRVVYADDQYINQQAMQLNFQDIGISHKLVIFSDGLDAVNYIDGLLKDIENRIYDSER